MISVIMDHFQSELKKIGQLNDRLKDFYEHIRTSYHFEFVERAVKQVEEQSKRFEEMLRVYHQKCTTALGKNNVEIMVSFSGKIFNSFVKKLFCAYLKI